MSTSEGSRVAVITGGTGGIGRATAERLADDGYDVLLTYRSGEAAAREVVAAIEGRGRRAVATHADLVERGDVLAIFDVLDAEFGRLDVLILNAAVIPLAPLTELAEEDYDRAFAANAKAAFLAFKEAAKRMPTGGRVIALSTGLTRSPIAAQTSYAASKSALETIVRSFSQEMGPRGITVNAVLPGPTATPGLEKAPSAMIEKLIEQTPLRRLGEPRDIADVIAFLVSDDARWITGQAINVSGGLHK